MAKNCRKKSRSAGEANLLGGLLVVMITKVNVIGSQGWWIDTICLYDHSLFKLYNEIKDKSILLGDHHSTKVAGIRDVKLKFTLKKILILKSPAHLRNKEESGLRLSPQQGWLHSDYRSLSFYIN